MRGYFQINCALFSVLAISTEAAATSVYPNTVLTTPFIDITLTSDSRTTPNTINGANQWEIYEEFYGADTLLKDWALIAILDSEQYSFRSNTENSTLIMTVNTTKVSAQLDVAWAFSVGNRYFTFFHALDGGLIVQSGGQQGTWIYPSCGSDLITGNVSSVISSHEPFTGQYDFRDAISGGDAIANFHRLSSQQPIASDTSNIRFEFTNNPIADTLTMNFTVPSIPQGLSCEFNAVSAGQDFQIYFVPDMSELLEKITITSFSFEGIHTGVEASNPTASPTDNPSASPTENPTASPTANPSKQPTRNPTRDPTANPSKQPTRNPTRNPTASPTANPSAASSHPSVSPSYQPSTSPSNNPTKHPSVSPSENPTGNPSSSPTLYPSTSPTKLTVSPSSDPTTFPTELAEGEVNTAQQTTQDVESEDKISTHDTGKGNSRMNMILILSGCGLFAVILAVLLLFCILGKKKNHSPQSPPPETHSAEMTTATTPYKQPTATVTDRNVRIQSISNVMSSSNDRDTELVSHVNETFGNDKHERQRDDDMVAHVNVTHGNEYEQYSANNDDDDVVASVDVTHGNDNEQHGTNNNNNDVDDIILEQEEGNTAR